MPKKLLAGILILAVALPACSLRRPTTAVLPISPRQALIAAIKDYQKTLGFEDTQNFARYSATTKALYRCYYTGKLELPASYEEMHLTDGNEAGCSLDEQKYDVLFYPLEAAASGASPVTPALTEASWERVLVVVLHEDFHNQEEAEQSAPEIAEAAATLIGFLAASNFAEQKYGPASPLFQGLRREAPLFLEKAHVVSAHYGKLSDLYAAVRAKKISRLDALARKSEIFVQLHRECSGITPDPVSFNKCPAALNNAGLAFDRTYTRYYPWLFDRYNFQGQDAGATVLAVKALKRLLATRPRSEADLIRAFERAPD